MEYNCKEISDKLTKLLRLEVIPIGIKGYEDIEEMEQIPKIRKPKHIFTPCQMIGQAVHMGFTIGFTEKDVVTHNCNSVIGLDEQDDEWMKESVGLFRGVWWEKENDVLNHQSSLTSIESVKYKGIVCSPLSSERIEPDICLINASPGAVFMLLSGFLHRDYKALDLKIVGESSCSMTWVKTLYTGQIGVSMPCFAEMRYAGMSPDKMILTMTPKDLVKAIEGVETLSKSGLRYPVPPYGTQVDVREGIGYSYDVSKVKKQQ